MMTTTGVWKVTVEGWTEDRFVPLERKGRGGRRAMGREEDSLARQPNPSQCSGWAEHRSARLG